MTPALFASFSALLNLVSALFPVAMVVWIVAAGWLPAAGVERIARTQSVMCALTSFSSLADDLDGAPMDGLQWLLNAPKTEAIAIDERGYPVRIPTVDPRIFALHKAWLARRPDRSPVKAARDREQAEAAALIASGYLRLPFDDKYLKGFPAPLREAAMPTFAANKQPGLSEDSPLEPDW